MNDSFSFEKFTTAVAHPCLDNSSVHSLWRSFCLGKGELTLVPTEATVFILGDPRLPTLEADKEFAITVDANGAAVVGKDTACLTRGLLCLLMKIRYDGERPTLPFTELTSNYLVKQRMLHICVFPENNLLFIKKLIRLAAMCQYTHIIIEFWGMLRFDCLKELSWPHAFTKEQAAELIRECRELGVEPVPMFNQLGHAAGARCCYGKHVVLDQAPQLQHLFTPDGWAWNIRSEEVMALLHRVRGELYELFGEGEYMHIGCDEANYISGCAELREYLPTYLGRLTSEVEAKGRRPLLWMDMLLEKDRFPGCFCTAEPDEGEVLRRATAPSTVFVDWQYDCTEVPIPSLLSLKNSGHDVIGAPWFKKENYKAHISTVSDNGLFGVMLTTWDLPRMQVHTILDCAKELGAITFDWSPYTGRLEETATILRRCSFEGNSYSDAGWAKAQVEI